VTAVVIGGAIDPDRVAAYIRWSTEEQAEGTTLEVQRDACRHYMLSQRWQCREELIFVDDGYSGGSLERPGLDRLRAAVRAGEVSCVVVYKLDRLSRSVLDTVSLVLGEWDGLCYVKSTREPVDTTTPAGKMFFYMLASYAEWERSVIRDRTMAGKAKRAQQGRNPGFTAPFGFRRGAAPGELAVDEAEAAIVRRIYREFLAGRTLRQIAAGLDQDRIRPRSAARWRTTTLSQMLANPIYAGTLAYGRSAALPAPLRLRAGRSRIRFEQPRYAAVQGAVPAIVSPEEFGRAAERRRHGGAVAGPRPADGEFLLSGIARCRCGAVLRGDTRSGRGARYYRCTGARLCQAGMIPAPALDGVVWHAAAGALPEGMGAQESGTKPETDSRQTERRLAELARRRRRIDSDYERGELPARLYAERVAALADEEARLRKAGALQERAPALQERAPAPGPPALFEAWAALEPGERRELLRLLLSACNAHRLRQTERAAGADRLVVSLTLRRAEPAADGTRSLPPAEPQSGGAAHRVSGPVRAAG
jgi:DNA invertase Pin-like site-specific DNA recombinase